MEKAKKQRTTAQSWLSRAGTRLESIVKASAAVQAEKGVGATSSSKAVLPKESSFLAAIKEFDSRIEAFDQAQAEVENLMDTDQLVTDIETVGELRDKLLEFRMEVEHFHGVFYPKNVTTHVTQCSAPPPTQAAPSARLPKLDLPQFTGNPMEWPSFWERFEVCVDKTELDCVSKFTYLRSVLSGEPARAIEGLALTSAHYSTACELLKGRYGRKELLIISHVQALLAIEPLKKIDLASLRTLMDSLMKHVRSLEAMEIKGEQYGVFLTPMVLSKLPSGVRLEWARDCEDHESDLQYLLDFIEKEVKRRERSSAFDVAPPPLEIREERRAAVKRKPVVTAAALQTSTVPQAAPCCACCGMEHRTWKCPKLLSAEQETREQILRGASLCFTCLRPGHRAYRCNFVCRQCNTRHKAFCCPRAGESTQRAAAAASDSMPSVSSCMNVNSFPSPFPSHSQVLLQTARVVLEGSEGSVPVTVLFDSGSDTTYVRSSLAKKVGAPHVGSRACSFVSFGGHKSEALVRDVHRLSLRKCLRAPAVFVDAISIPLICTPLQSPRLSPQCLSAVSGFELAGGHPEGEPLEIDILVGLDHYWQLMTSDVVRLPSGLVLQGSVFGYILSGKCPVEQGNVSCLSTQLLNLNDLPESLVRSFWELDTIGVKEDDQHDGSALNRFEANLVKREGRYEVGLLWKEDPPNLLENRSQAEMRLRALERKLASNPSLRARYDQVFQDMEKNGVIEEVSLSETYKNQVFYLPHRPVVKECSSSTKVRPVFDASAKGPNGVALNDCIDSGPALMPNLFDVVLRFRRWQIGLTGDITKAFLQLSLKAGDRDVHRFLWSQDSRVRVMRFNRVTFGVACSPFLLNATIRHHLSLYDDSVPSIVELKDNLYVDDFLTGADSREEVCELQKTSCAIMAEAGMELAKWRCSDGPHNGQVLSGLTLDHEDGPDVCTVLGVAWAPPQDVFMFVRAPLPGDLVVTKRVLLSIIARIFDPVGFIAPVIMTAKILFQQLWKLGIQWDEMVPPEIQHQVSDWIADLTALNDLRIPRCFFSSGWKGQEEVTELHVFADASEAGYGACVYLVRSEAGKQSATLVASRARVAPVKALSLPRLELMACLLGAKLLVYVREALRLPVSVRYNCWSDSMVALGWIRGEPNRWKQFVSNRVKDIQRLTDPASWLHCPGVSNPADLLTRGLHASALVSSPVWFCGPDIEQLSALKDSVDVHAVVLSMSEMEVDSGKSAEICAVLDLQRFSSLDKVACIVAWIFRFYRNLRMPSPQRVSGKLASEELISAHRLLVSYVQECAFGEELVRLRQGLPVCKTSSIYKLRPFLGEDGLVRVQGRLQQSQLPFEGKHPIILPKGHFALLVV